MYLYFFSYNVHNESGVVAHGDGVLSRDQTITSLEDYQGVRKAILEEVRGKVREQTSSNDLHILTLSPVSNQ